LIDDVLQYADDDPSLLEPLAAAPQYLRVEVVYAVRNEAALHLEDVLARRTRISIEYPHRGVDCAHEVAELMAPALGWSAEDIAYEVDTYRARVEAEIASQREPDDASADALRASAPESRGQILEPVPVPE
uniref:glycerol-3-phosphate dehydrogenase C-terminal domain-containing protein n=1 Tax=Gordonia sp. (in: high G+C Gram-positive bacteria) TaxID=84139 RepID=UPI002FDACC81